MELAKGKGICDKIFNSCRTPDVLSPGRGGGVNVWADTSAQYVPVPEHVATCLLKYSSGMVVIDLL